MERRLDGRRQPPSAVEPGERHPNANRSTLDSPRVFSALSIMAIGCFIAENFLTFPLSVPFMRSLAAGASILDMRFGYSLSSAYQLLDALGRSGRLDYLAEIWTVDLLLLALFGLFLAAVIRRGVFRALYLVPILAAAFDYAENTAITILLVRYPVHSAIGVYIASGLTRVKLCLYAASILMGVGGILVRSLKNAAPRRSRTTLM